ncbi:MAG TPA: glutaredoxin family protein [Candidatus Paceibacterota bacterium]|jgi:glutaredoxin-like YruB-family protein|nr:glutaredoxin family protein [Candidatus Paceibacterota bacterium]
MTNVEIYSTPTCIHCGHAKEFLKEHNVPYTEYNVLADVERRKEMVDITGQMGVPVIVVGENVMVGFNQSKLAELVGVPA